MSFPVWCLDFVCLLVGWVVFFSPRRLFQQTHRKQLFQPAQFNVCRSQTCRYTKLCFRKQLSGEQFTFTALQMCYFLVFLIYSWESFVIVIFVTKFYEQDVQFNMVEMLFCHRKKTVCLCLCLLNSNARSISAWESYI